MSKKGTDERILIRRVSYRAGKSESGRMMEQWLNDNGAERVTTAVDGDLQITTYRYLGETIKFVRRA